MKKRNGKIALTEYCDDPYTPVVVSFQQLLDLMQLTTQMRVTCVCMEIRLEDPAPSYHIRYYYGTYNVCSPELHKVYNYHNDATNFKFPLQMVLIMCGSCFL